MLGLPARLGTPVALVAAIATGFLLVLATALATTSRDVADGPVTQPPDDQVVATLATPGAGYSRALREKLRAARAQPSDLAVAKAAARQLIDDGRLAGDARLVGAALGVLRPFFPAPDAETLYLSAVARQYQHDFPGALDQLDRALVLSPADASALMTRATIQVVTGHLDAAALDCRRLYALPRPDLGFLCQSAALTLTAEAPTVYARLDGLIARGLLDPSLIGYARTLMGEIDALQGRADRARSHFEAVLAEDPDALRVRMMLADLLLARGEDAATLELLDDAPEVDGTLVRRAIAAARLGDVAILEPARADLSRRFRQNLDLGLTAHAREETRFFLEVARDPDLALARAKVNWDLQHEIEDAQLLLDAAMAAGSPEAAAPVLAWMADQGVSVPALRIPDAVRRAAQ